MFCRCEEGEGYFVRRGSWVVLFKSRRGDSTGEGSLSRRV